jgi:fatty acid desaturase
MQGAIWTLIVGAVGGLTALGFANQPVFRALAVWIFCIVTVGIFGYLLVWWSVKKFGKPPEIFDWKQISAEYDLRDKLVIIWVVVTVFLFCLWMLPHILPKQQLPQPTLSSKTTR